MTSAPYATRRVLKHAVRLHTVPLDAQTLGLERDFESPCPCRRSGAPQVVGSNHGPAITDIKDAHV